jgi:hypothetical protein
MWCNGRKFRIKMLDDKMKTSDYGITVVFKVTNISSRSDKNTKKLRIGTMAIWRI